MSTGDPREAGDPGQAPDALARFRRWAAAAVALAVLGYLGYAVWKGFSETAEALVRFRWSFYVPVLALTLVNYGLRYAKWAYLLSLLGIPVPHRTNVWVFLTGLAMVISPAKAGEVVKPWMVQQVNGAPYTRTLPALVTERGTDGLAVVILAAISVSTYAADQVWLILGTLAAIAGVVATLSVKPLAHGVFDLLDRVQVLHGLVGRLRETYDATWICLRPRPLAVTLSLSLVAWAAEGVGMWLVFLGLSRDVPLDACMFLYAFATVFGAPSPGGMGMADAALVEGALSILPGVTPGEALAASLLVRVATLWFGVLLGALALLRTASVIDDARAAARAGR
jgi:uncharacterized protein (TIRG00374 family)